MPDDEDEIIPVRVSDEERYGARPFADIVPALRFGCEFSLIPQTNRIVLTGNVVSRPQFFYGKFNAVRLNFALSSINADGETEFVIPCVAYGPMAKALIQYLQKRDCVRVLGRLTGGVPRKGEELTEGDSAHHSAGSFVVYILSLEIFDNIPLFWQHEDDLTNRDPLGIEFTGDPERGAKTWGPPRFGIPLKPKPPPKPKGKPGRPRKIPLDLRECGRVDFLT